MLEASNKDLSHLILLCTFLCLHCLCVKLLNEYGVLKNEKSIHYVSVDTKM